MSDPGTSYRVLARKYRPQSFAEIIGQDAMVRVLSNAIASGRIAQAFMLTGVRGIGKTTTARIIARALNCIGPDGAGGPTVSPCGDCVHCRAIAEDRHVDVIEMDAASHTGVDKMRELLDGVRYRPVSARYKIYIIDEVHMLSGHSFNALLKTLEEPPPDVKFIFATTEIRKVPLTVLSRCQRFSLRRVPVELLVEHYRRIAEIEGVAVSPAALGLIARAADGSVRDGLSLLDQAIALRGDTAAEGAIDADAVRDMLGIADRGLVWELFETVLRGNAAGALAQMDALYQGGADPQIVLQDLLDLTHFVTRLKLAPSAGTGDPLEEGDRVRALVFAETLSMPVLARAWQMLLKGIEELQSAPVPAQAASMVLIRLAYVADLPVPADLVRAAMSHDGGDDDAALPQQKGPALAAVSPSTRSPRSEERAGVRGQSAEPLPTPSPGGPLSGRATLASGPGQALSRSAGEALAEAYADPLAQPGTEPQTEPLSAAALDPLPRDFADVVAMFDTRREALLRSHLVSNVHLVSFEPGRIEFRPAEGAPRDLANRLGQLLSEWTGTRWVVAISQAAGAPTLAQQQAQRENVLRNEVAAHPLVRAVLEAFPGATIASVRDRPAAADPGTDAAEGDEFDDGTDTGEDA
ncbi:MAG: DNA polymerase III subunit gamma/tau [Alphaproteobacteria bacterium]